MAKIGDDFVDETSNMHLCEFKINGVKYISSEHYFQANKTLDKKEFEHVLKSSSGIESWSRGNSVTLRKDWEAIKVETMYIGARQKYEQDKSCKKALVNSKGKIKYSGSGTFWNYWNSLILERIREEIMEKDDKSRDDNKIKKLKLEMDEFKEKMMKRLKF